MRGGEDVEHDISTLDLTLNRLDLAELTSDLSWQLLAT